MNNFNRKNERNIKKEEKEEKEDYNDIILNKLNKITILYIKIYYLIMLLLIIIITSLSIYKSLYSINFNKIFNNSFYDISALSNKYSSLYYFFNTLGTLLIFPDDNRKKIFENILENMNDFIEKQNNNILNILSNKRNNYRETSTFYDILMLSKNNSTEVLRKYICEGCLLFLDSYKNIFSSGLDFSYKFYLSEVQSIFLDYKKLKNKTDFCQTKNISKSKIISNWI